MNLSETLQDLELQSAKAGKCPKCGSLDIKARKNGKMKCKGCGFSGAMSGGGPGSGRKSGGNSKSSLKVNNFTNTPNGSTKDKENTANEWQKAYTKSASDERSSGDKYNNAHLYDKAAAHFGKAAAQYKLGNTDKGDAHFKKGSAYDDKAEKKFG